MIGSDILWSVRFLAYNDVNKDDSVRMQLPLFYTLWTLSYSAPSASALLTRLRLFSSPQLPSQCFSNALKLNFSLARFLEAWRILLAWVLESVRAWWIASANDLASVAWNPGRQLSSRPQTEGGVVWIQIKPFEGWLAFKLDIILDS